MKTKTAAIVIGIVFIAVGLLGFVPNPIIGESDTAIFHADTVHNLVHIVSGALFIIIALFSPGSVSLFLKVFGVVYFLLGVLGLINIGSEGMGTLLGFLHINGADNFLHIALGLVIFLAAYAGAQNQGRCLGVFDTITLSIKFDPLPAKLVSLIIRN